MIILFIGLVMKVTVCGLPTYYTTCITWTIIALCEIRILKDLESSIDIFFRHSHTSRENHSKPLAYVLNYSQFVGKQKTPNEFSKHTTL